MRRQRTDYLGWAKQIPQRHVLSLSSVYDPAIQAAANAAYASPRFAKLLKEPNPWGLPRLRQAIAARYCTPGIGESNILLTPGASSAIFILCKTFLRPGDEIIIESPCYEPFLLAAQACGGRVKFWPRRPKDFSLALETLERLFSKKTRLVLLSNLHNPTGHGSTAAEFAQLARCAAQHDAWAAVDEIYLDLVPRQPRSGAQAIRPAVALGQQSLVSFSSLSKVYGLSRLRAGWIAGPAEALERLRATYKTVINSGSLDTEIAWSLVMPLLDSCSKRTRATVQANRLMLERELGALFDGGVLSGRPPAFSSICFPEVTFLRNLGDRDAEKAMDILEHECGVVPGGFFGGRYQNHIRIGLGAPQEKFRVAVRKLGKTLVRLYSRKLC